MTVYTIGFTRKSAEVFFTRFREAGVRRIVDVRLNNTSQLAGFAKMNDLRYFAKAICDIDYVHAVDLAPSAEILNPFKKLKGEWDLYERQFLELMARRRVEETTPREWLDQGCLLCSEERPHHCHRRLVAEYLQRAWGDVGIEHIP